MEKSSKYTIRAIPPDQYEEWDAFVASVPGGSFLMSTAWIGAVARAMYGEMKVWGVYQGDHLVAGTSLISLRPLSLTRLLRSVPLTPYTAIAMKPRGSSKEAKIGSYRLAILDLVARTLENEADAIEILGHPGLTDMRPFCWRGWTSMLRYTYLIDTSDRGRPWSERVDPRIHKTVRKWREKGIEVQLGTDADALYEMQRRTLERKEAPWPVSREAFRELCTVLERHGRLAVYVVRVDSQIVCAYSAVKDYQGNALGFFGGTDPDYLKSGVSAYALWTMIEDISQQGFVSFDLNGANIPSIAAFKSQYGGVLTPYYSVLRRSPKARLLDWCWQKTREWGFSYGLKRILIG
jgi:hypothetical protein